MFKVGDYIVYPMYGAGIITEIVEKDFLGEMRTYYNVSLPYCRMEASVPVDNTEKLGVRSIIDPGRIEEVIAELRKDTEPMNPNWNKRYRENSTGEKKLLSTAKQILESELVYSGGYTMEEADEMVESNI